MPLCTLILEGLSDEYQSEYAPKEDSTKGSLEDLLLGTSVSISRISGSAFPVGETDNRSQVAGFSASVNVSYQDRSAPFTLKTALLLYPGEDELAIAPESGVSSRRVASDAGSPAALSLVSRWLEYCSSHHSDCNFTSAGLPVDEVRGPTLPTRVIDVGERHASRDIVRLIETNGMRGPYCSLSYCWGAPGTNSLLTTKATYDHYIKGILFKDLPKTYQDAVTVTRALDVQYLWIDALCIIQKNPEDWLTESNKVGEYYGNARLVIAATGAANPREGLFLPRPPKRGRVKMQNMTGSWGPMYAELADRFTDGSERAGPLETRAWAAQESILARRLVRYTKNQMMWRCSDATQREDGRESPFEPHWESWPDIVCFYTARKLTYGTDRLAAVQGFATAIQTKYKTTYVSGLWKESLPEQLVWKAASSDEITRPDFLISLTPTWS